MKNSNLMALVLFILIGSAMSFQTIAEIEQVISISGAGFKPYSGVMVSETNGCYAGVNYSNVDVPIGSLLVGASISITNIDGIGQVRFSMHKSNSFLWDGFMINHLIDLEPGDYSEYIVLSPTYLTKENDFFELGFVHPGSQTAKLCGVKIHYLPASEIIFINGFD